MNKPFPFGFPAPTAMYLGLYVLTLAVHVLFMNYALAGSLYIGVRGLLRHGRTAAATHRSDASHDGKPAASISGAVVDALPFSVGLAITAGVAPLLFVQILYEKRFYTANLLLQHRWMLLVPVLLVGFYLLYLLKSEAAKQRPWLWRLSAVGAAVCFVFVAWSWTENHLLSRDDHAWVATYAADKLVYYSPEIWPRLLMWVLGAFASLALLVGFQLRTASARNEQVPPSEVRQLANLGLGGVLLGGAAAFLYAQVAGPSAIAGATAPLALPYLIATVVAGATQAICWLTIRRRGSLDGPALPVAAGGLALALIASGVVRESLRLAMIDISTLYNNHTRAAEAQGLWLFVLFALFNGGVITFAARIARRAALQGDDVGDKTAP